MPVKIEKPVNVFKEINALVSNYKCFSLFATDNYILFKNLK